METVFNQSIWGDEGFSAILSMKPLPEIIKIISHDTSPPLWNIFEHFAFQAFGTSEVVIRGLSFFFFLVAIFFTYKIATLFWSRKTGLLATLFIFLNPFFFTYAFEGRMYSIMSAGVAGSMYYFAKSFFGEGGKWTRIGYIFWTLWALYSHHFAIFAIIVQGIWWLYEFIFGRRKTAKRIFKSWLVIGVGYTPWLLPLYNQTKMVGSGFWLGTPTLKDFGKLVTDYLAEGIKDENLKVPMLDTPLYVASFYAVGVTLVLRKWWKSIKKSIFLLMWFLGPIILAWLVSQKFQSIFFNRYLLYTIPAAMLILVSSRNKISLIALAIVLGMFGVMDYQYFTHPVKLPFRQMAAYVHESEKQGDYFINWYSNGTHHIWETKYYGIDAPIYVQGEGNLPYFVGTALMEKSDIVNKIPEGVERVGVVTSGPIDEVHLPGFEQEEVKEFDGLKFMWYIKSNEE